MQQENCFLSQTRHILLYTHTSTHVFPSLKVVVHSIKCPNVLNTSVLALIAVAERRLVAVQLVHIEIESYPVGRIVDTTAVELNGEIEVCVCVCVGVCVWVCV